MKRYFISLVAALVCSASAWAVMASPEPIVMTQADGSTVTLKLVGDEFHSYYTRMDGTPVRLQKGMWINDASVASEAQQARQARRAAQQIQKTASYPLSGTPKSLVILVNFKDLAFRYSLDDFQRLLTESGYSQNGGIGSCRDYFIACSDSIFQPQFDCYGPVTVSQNYAYYGGNNDAKVSQMIVEACNLVADGGVDMAQYDTDNDGRLDNVFVYYAGHNEAEHGGENTIWPHRSAIGGDQRVQGKKIYDYACTSELRGSSGYNMCGIGTFCHEFGHVLGLPDYYDTENDLYTVGSWDIMCSGNYNGNGKTPPSYTSGERFQLGWLTPIQLTNAGSYTLEPLETSNKAYLIAASEHNLNFNSPSPSEYWLLENRQNVGWDATSSCLPATGMLIWHIDYSSSAWGGNRPNNSTPLRYDIEEAGGVKGYSATSDPFPGSKNVTNFTPTLHNGTIVEQPLTGIAQVGENIVFTFKSNNFMFLPTELPVIQSTYNEDTHKSYYPASVLKIAGEHLDPEVDIEISISGNGFYISKDSTTLVRNLKTRANVDSILDYAMYVYYKPNRQVCDIQRGTITVRQGTATGSYIVRGTSPRPVLINVPALNTIEEVTPTSFKINWEPEADAEEYYVTLYHMEEGRESTMESFEGFDDEAVVHEAGWYTSFYRTTTKAKEEGAVSMWFKEDKERMMSPIYHLPVVELSMWLNAPATTDSEVGWMLLMGYSDLGIDTIDTIKVVKNTKKYTYKRSFKESQGYKRFELYYSALGGEGVCLDAFTTTFNKKTIYTYKGREMTIPANEGCSFYAYDLLPNTDYYVRLQCSENKGCEEHLSDLGQADLVFTKAGEGVGSKHLTLDVDSIHYNPATHVVYIPQNLNGGSINLYNASGELVTTIAVLPEQNIVPLPEGDLQFGAMYLVKYLPANKLNRKSPWLKIIYM